MDEERKPWDRMMEQGESAKWFSRFDRFRLMKPWERSIAAVFHEENSKKLEKTRKNQEPDGTWYKFAQRWKWEERAAAWDKYRLDERDKQIAAEEAEVLRKGYALKHERIKALNEKALNAEEPYTDPDTGKTHQLWNSPEHMREWRGLLDDIAKEKGERIRKQEVTGKDGAPLGLVGTYDPEQHVVQLPRKSAPDETVKP